MTTITLDDDVALLIRQEAQRAGLTPSDVANRVLKRQLRPLLSQQAPRPFVVEPFEMNLPPEWTSGKIQDLMDLLDARERDADAQR